MLQAFFAAWVASCDIPVWNSALASIELLLWFWVQVGHSLCGCSAMVELRHNWEIKFQDEKWSAIPDSLIESFEHQQYLRIRPTCQSLCKLISKSNQKNQFLSSRTQLLKMISDRNEAAEKNLELAEKELKQEAGKRSDADLFNQEDNDADQQAVKKRKLNNGEYVVSIQVLGKEVNVLMKGNRPGRSDLLVLMEPAMLERVFQALARDAEECLSGTKRQYTKKVASDKVLWHVHPGKKCRLRKCIESLHGCFYLC